MGNLPSCCGILSKHVYPLELPKMEPFCMKIIFKKISGENPHTPFNNNSFRHNNIYAHAHTEPGSVQKWNKSHGKSCPGPLTPPPLFGFFFWSVFFCFLFFVFCFYFFKILLRMKINSLALVYLKINFLVELMLKINNLSRQYLLALPLPQNQMVAFCIMMSLRYCGAFTSSSIPWYCRCDHKLWLSHY